MKIQPTFAEVKKIAETGRYHVLPVSMEIRSGFTTPIETMKILKHVPTHCYMLESAQARVYRAVNDRPVLQQEV